MNRRDGIVCALGAALAPALRAQDEAALPKPVGWPTLQLLGGGTIEPKSWLGHYSVVVLFATWCPFCKRHNMHVNKLYQNTRNGPLRVLGLSLDNDARTVVRYLAANDYAFPVALDTAGLRTQLTQRKTIPMTCVIDGRGRLVQAMAGEMFEEDVLALAALATRRSS